MTEGKKSTAETGGTAPNRNGLIALSASWLLGFGALALFAAPSPQADAVFMPATLETTDAPQSIAASTPAAQSSVDFIVRFDDVEEVDTCLDIFKDTPDEARTIFTNWARDHATLAGMKLKKTSYAGELILSWSTEDGHRPNRADIIAKQRELQAMPLVKYADPDYTAHAGETTP